MPNELENYLARRRERLERQRDELRRHLCRLDRDPAARRQVELEAGWIDAEIAKLEKP